MDRAFQNLQEFINHALDGRHSIVLLEAGCGSATYINFAPKTYTIGIDVSKKQLERNDRLDQKILGDIQYYQLPTEQYDVIICWNVLEHVQKPTLALENFSKAIKPGGLIIISIPNLYSLKGLLTKFSPHWFHIFVWRYVYGIKEAGKDDVAPFKTFLRKEISPLALQQFAPKNNLEIPYYLSYGIDEFLDSRNQFISRFLGYLIALQE